ncbi:uncharacterized protein DUF4252 [Balneicella halophila]|uniref:Uncharacterized protein DUF4252 n=1 Tax=Balneicella halophila TaxID=1537566 RepID=A0A7L4USV9_BALHA|nr:DUF4252 domain-containing protein [Balneicella halophila]PVX52337.1 uncharacterized protein DUF4252 [Balneicella halophila]
MRKIILFIISLVLSVTAVFAQNFEELYEGYKDVEDVERIKVAPSLFKGISKIMAGVAELSDDMTEEEKEGIKLLENIDEIQLLISEKVDLSKDLKKIKFMKKNNYVLLMESSNADDDIYLYSKDNEKSIFSDVVILIKDKKDKSNLLANIKGNITPENISRLIVITKENCKINSKSKKSK